MTDIPIGASPEQSGSAPHQSIEFLQSAQRACSAGDAVLGMHLYLTAFESAESLGDEPASDFIGGLKEAFAIACNAHERSLAEYIFEKLYPYLTEEEMELCGQQMQQMAFDKLEELGVSRDDLQNVANMFSGDFMGMPGPASLKIDHISMPLPSIPPFQGLVPDQPFGALAIADDKPMDLAAFPFPGIAEAAEQFLADGPEDAHCEETEAEALSEASDPAPLAMPGEVPAEDVLADAQAPEDGASDAPEPVAEASEADSAEVPAEVADSDQPAPIAEVKGQIQIPKELFENLKFPTLSDKVKEPFNYRSLAGYATAIGAARRAGVGQETEEGYGELVSMLNERHGFETRPPFDSILFSSPVREDAARFAEATAGEFDLPLVRMSLEEGMQGSVLCVTTNSERPPHMNKARSAFTGPTVLLLEDLDLWQVPQFQAEDGIGALVAAQASRGAREAIQLIRNSVDSAEVHVLATCLSTGKIEPFFADLIEPFVMIDIELPTPEERLDIWMEIAREHPSLRAVDRAALVRLSANMPRWDIYMACREALEEAYRQSLQLRRYVPVSQENLFDKLAAFQPLESEEYQHLEDACVRSLRRELDDLEEIVSSLEF